MVRFSPVSNNRGFTIVQLVVVLAIVGVLLSAAIPIYQASNRTRAQTDLSNEISALVSAQRTRSMKSGLATMILFDTADQVIQPLIGANSSCESTRLPLAYPGDADASTPLAIVLKGDNITRTTEYKSSEKYKGLLLFSSDLATKSLLCFVPNGSVRIFSFDSTLEEKTTTTDNFSLQIWQTKYNTSETIGQSLEIVINRFGRLVSRPAS